MSAVIVVKGKNKFVIGHDSCVMEEYEDGHSAILSRASVRKLAVWPSFAIGYAGDVRIPHWIAKQRPLHKIEDIARWTLMPNWYSGCKLVVMFPNGQMYRGQRHWDLSLRRIEVTPVKSHCDVGCWYGSRGYPEATEGAMRKALERGRAHCVRPPFRTYTLPFGKEFPPPYGPRGYTICW